MNRFMKFLKHWISQIIDLKNLKMAIPRYIAFLKDWKTYTRMKGAENINFFDTIPHIHDKTPTHPFDSHYFYQNIWAFKRIFKSNCEYHIDVASRLDFVGMLTTITNVTFIDIRPFKVNLKNLEVKKGNILSIPYGDNKIKSLSCLHVAEHIGLGRYGDPLDPLGTRKAAKELARVLASKGNLYFALPIGKPQTLFNIHRIHSTKQILDYFSDLSLIEISGITDNGEFIENIDRKILDSCKYGCGLFWFTKN